MQKFIRIKSGFYTEKLSNNRPDLPDCECFKHYEWVTNTKAYIDVNKIVSIESRCLKHSNPKDNIYYTCILLEGGVSYTIKTLLKCL